MKQYSVDSLRHKVAIGSQLVEYLKLKGEQDVTFILSMCVIWHRLSRFLSCAASLSMSANSSSLSIAERSSYNA